MVTLSEPRPYKNILKKKGVYIVKWGKEKPLKNNKLKYFI